jgi:hypothetical protein
VKICPSCGSEVVTLITDLATGHRYCHVCAPDKNDPVVKVAAKMSTGRLEDYPLEERLRDLRGEPTPTPEEADAELYVKIFRKWRERYMKNRSAGSVTVTYADLVREHKLGRTDWRFAGSMMFQHMIHEHGTEKEKQRLRKLKVGYWA